ncbi:MAG: aldo/keto reductase [Myxococcota bacterium]
MIEFRHEVMLGLWSIGGDWGPVDVPATQALLRRAVDLGIRWVDTAPIYGRGEADRLLATSLPELDLRVATKVGPRFEGAHPRCDLSPDSVRRDLEESLRRLGVDHVDLVQAHWPCERGTPLEDTVGALKELVQEGKAKAWGLCNFGPDAAEAQPATLQAAYSLMRREVEQNGVRERCQKDGVSLLAYETLGRGLLAGRFRSLPRFAEGDHRRRDPRFWGARFYRTNRSVDLLRQATARLGYPTAALAAGWVLAQAGVSGVIVGARTADQLAESVRAREVADDPRALRLLDRIAATFR